MAKIPLPAGALPVDPELLADGAVLAFDGALAKTGWAVVGREAGAAPVLLASGLVRTTSSLTSHEQTFARADLLHQGLSEVVTAWAPRVQHVVCERPAVAGMRIESSLMAAYAVHRLSGGRLRLISRQHAVRVFCGPAEKTPGRSRAEVNAAGKARSKAAVHTWLAPAHGLGQDAADAALIAMTCLYDQAQEGC